MRITTGRMTSVAKQAYFAHVPASKSETGRDEIYVVFDGKRIAQQSDPGMWVSIEPGFHVLVDGAELIVIHDTKRASVH
jgi:hypothetical protein